VDGFGLGLRWLAVGVEGFVGLAGWVLYALQASLGQARSLCLLQTPRQETATLSSHCLAMVALVGSVARSEHGRHARACQHKCVTASLERRGHALTTLLSSV
jgi:hypothetical protein